MPCLGVDSGGGTAGFNGLPVVPVTVSRVVRFLID
ncbi:MAG: hypothetical protein AWU55_90 [Halomonadaceae bacterium T82-2]|nr:MAG: hypothetical protein AWU55_90 [Halomonadaceae bacterium T82-2]